MEFEGKSSTKKAASCCYCCSKKKPPAVRRRGLLWRRRDRERRHELKTHYSHCSLPCCLGCCILQSTQSSAARCCKTTGCLWEHREPTCIERARLQKMSRWMLILILTHAAHHLAAVRTVAAACCWVQEQFHVAVLWGKSRHSLISNTTTTTTWQQTPNGTYAC